MNTLELSILLPAMLAGSLVVLTHIPLGQEVLRRGIIFIDLAIAQIAGLGVIAAYSFGWETHGWEVQIVAVSTALTGALFLYWCEKSWPDVQEAIIGVLFILAANLFKSESKNTWVLILAGGLIVLYLFSVMKTDDGKKLIPRSS